MTDALWAPKGESGVISTTHDLIAFERALLVDKTLLPEDALEAMTDWVKLYSQSGDIVSFGLGIFQHDLKNGQIFQGFAGGTLGTSTVTYCNPFDNSVIAIAATLAGVTSNDNAMQLDTILRGLDAWAPVVDDGSALEIRSVSAADSRSPPTTPAARAWRSAAPPSTSCAACGSSMPGRRTSRTARSWWSATAPRHRRRRRSPTSSPSRGTSATRSSATTT